jgi:hypothetical protein
VSMSALVFTCSLAMSDLMQSRTVYIHSHSADRVMLMKHGMQIWERRRRIPSQLYTYIVIHNTFKSVYRQTYCCKVYTPHTC